MTLHIVIDVHIILFIYVDIYIDIKRYFKLISYAIKRGIKANSYKEQIFDSYDVSA